MVEELRIRTKGDIDELQAVALELKELESQGVKVTSPLDRVTNLIERKKSYLNLPPEA